MSLEDAKERYHAAMHGVQSGIAMKITRGVAKDCEPKHLRVGVNSALVETGALIGLLIEKGVFTEGEWYEALAAKAEQERAMYEAELSDLLGAKVTLR